MSDLLTSTDSERDVSVSTQTRDHRVRPRFVDSFDDDRAPGAVVGSRTPEGMRRWGKDAGDHLSIDRGHLRVACPDIPGWNREALAYDAMTRQRGRTLAVCMVNGHNSSQTWPESYCHTFTRTGWWKRRIRGTVRRWTAGQRETSAIPWAWIPGRLERAFRADVPHKIDWPPLKENMATGWWPADDDLHPDRIQNGFLMRAGDLQNGTLLARVDERWLPVVHAVQNVPLYLVCRLRPHGAVYYVASLPDVKGLAAAPSARPVAIDTVASASRVAPALTQSILGEIGFRVDTRVSSVHVADDWFASDENILLADDLTGTGQAERTAPERGTSWALDRGGFMRTDRGIKPLVPSAQLWQQVPEPPGLMHVTIDRLSAPWTTGLTFRMSDPYTFRCVLIGSDKAYLYTVAHGKWKQIATDDLTGDGVPGALQVLDDGTSFQAAWNGRLLFDGPTYDSTDGSASGVGILCRKDTPTGPGNGQTMGGVPVLLTNLEVHPRQVPLPDALLGDIAWTPPPVATTITDDFSTDDTEELEGRMVPGADIRWTRTEGGGLIDAVPDQGAVVRATLDEPNPERTLYTIPWGDPTCASIEIDVMPPGDEGDAHHRGRAGVVFWEDDDRYLIVSTYLDPWKIGRSISSFFRLDGTDDLYRAVWTNVGDRLEAGVPYCLRVDSNGDHYVVRLNGEPVLYRAWSDVYPGINPMQIRRVGLVVNWEYGNDTGSAFRRFVCSGREDAVHEESLQFGQSA
ncbi:hypothetical protein CRI94_16665 [Longibacter salinarum]|uniref:Uncharacterized protein n=1 Tax=Longibacter salinarum TaxID=1850348 RepID=A0A2A8CU08_9BACT|nr:hypothetical protein [Longibacter salinarum]PEN11214.1 hypothetical protein CRI94_16665 [Longibacter salinarum]